MNGPGDESAGGTGRDGDASPNRYDQLISENQFLLEKLHAEHDRRARLKLEAMLAETPAIHFELDQQQRLAYVNPTWSRELLHPVSDGVGKTREIECHGHIKSDVFSIEATHHSFDVFPYIAQFVDLLRWYHG